MRRVDHLRIDRSSGASQFPEQIFPDAAPCPAHKAVINRGRRAVSFGTIAPTAATLENVNDAADDPTIVGSLHSAHIGRQMRFNTPPLLFAQPEQIFAHLSSPNTNQHRIVSAERLMSFDPSPFRKNILVFSRPKSSAYPCHPASSEGRFAIVTDVRWDAVDARRREDERRQRGRRSRVVLTPRRWRQVGGAIRLATVANKPGRRGEHEGSR